MTCCLWMIFVAALIASVCAQGAGQGNSNPSGRVGQPATPTTNASGRVPGATLTVLAVPPGIFSLYVATTRANEGTDAAVTTTTTTLATTISTTGIITSAATATTIPDQKTSGVTTISTTGIITSAATATTIPDQKTSGVVETVRTGGPLDGSLPAWAIAVISVGICLGLAFSALAVVLLARKKRDSTADATATHTNTRSSTYASNDGTPLATSNSYDAPPAAVFVNEASASNSNHYDAVDDPLSL
jgi:hypothetical protein